MSVTTSLASGRRHPWLAQFEAAPEASFGDLLAGYAVIPPYERADAPDAARMLFGPLPADDPARRALGPAILSWLERRRREAITIAPHRLQRRVREVCEAFEIVALLGLTDAAVELRRRFPVLIEWVGRLVLSPARDARAEYWRMIALTQPIVARVAPGFDRTELAPFWLRICREAGGLLPRRYLDIGLLGLRRLPPTPSGSEAPWLAGLAQWALARHPSESEFKLEWLALKALYPRPPARWRKLVSELLSARPFRDADVAAPGWWRTDPDFAGVTLECPQSATSPLRSPSPGHCDRVIERFAEGFQVVEPLIDRLMMDHRHFASITGVSYYMVRAMHALGQGLIERNGDDPGARARKSQGLAREGLTWEPSSGHLWALWRDALASEGALEAAELLGWEFVRRDPANPEARTQLATLLAEALDQPREAEALLRETIARFPDNRHARNQLAELLIMRDRVTEAGLVVDAAFAANVLGEATYALRARLQAHAGRHADATATIQRGLADFPSSPVLQNFKRRLDSGRPLLLRARPAAARVVPHSSTTVRNLSPSDAIPDEVRRRGGLRRLRSRLGCADQQVRQGAIAELQEILRDDPTFAYAELLAARQRIWQADTESLPSFAVAFEAALASEDRAKLEDLARRQPRLEALTLVARAVLGDDDAAWLVDTWLRQPPPETEQPVIAALRVRLMEITGGNSIIQTIAEHRATIIMTLYDTNEATLGDVLQAA